MRSCPASSPPVPGPLRGDGSKRVRVGDFMHHDSIVLDSPDDRLSPDDTLIEGEFLHQELRPGLTLHVSDVMEERAFTATSTLPEGLSCIFFLDGAVDLRIGERDFGFRGNQRGAMTGAAIMNASPESFRRTSQGRQHLRHLVVSATPEWLNLEALQEVDDARLGARLLKDHLADHRWSVTPRLAELVRQFFTPSSFVPALRNLYLEGRAVEIVAETMAAVMQAGRSNETGAIMTRADMARLDRARDLIAANLAAPLSVETIAREAGISASGLQRLFRLTEGHGVFEYVRRLRLERAFRLLQAGENSVQEASIIAGYSSPANFATAFRRQFGVSPREVPASRQA